MRVSVATKKSHKPKHIAVLIATNDDWSAGSRFEQTDATENESTHDSFAELRLRYKHRPETVRWDNQGLYRSLRVSVDQRWPSRQLSQFAHEISGTMRDDCRALSRLVVLSDIDITG